MLGAKLSNPAQFPSILGQQPWVYNNNKKSLVINVIAFYYGVSTDEITQETNFGEFMKRLYFVLK